MVFLDGGGEDREKSLCITILSRVSEKEQNFRMLVACSQVGGCKRGPG